MFGNDKAHRECSERFIVYRDLLGNCSIEECMLLPRDNNMIVKNCQDKLDLNETSNRVNMSKRTMILTMVLAFMVPAAIMALALLKIRVWPGGSFTLYVYDMQALFNPIITSLRYIGNSDHSVFHSFYGALGNNAFLNCYQFIVDPTMWITVLVPLEYMPDAIYFITLFKIGLCGFTSSCYFFFGIKGKKYPSIILILSICYALMSYNIIYSQIILFYNVIALTPIILIGIENILDEKKGGIYIIFMTFSLYYSVQLSYMVGVFAILYLVFRLSEKPCNTKRVILVFFIDNLISLGLFMPVFFPMFFNLINGRFMIANARTGMYFYYPIMDVIKQLGSCQYSTIESGGLPNIFCGSFIPVIAALCIVLPIKPKKTRMIIGGILVFFIASFCVAPLNRLWHGFNEPNSFPARYSFLLSLFLIILAYHSACFLLERRTISKSLFWTISGVTMIISCVELYLNAGYILNSLNIENHYCVRAAYQMQLNDMEDALDQINDDDFYRIGRDITFSHNDGMIYGYNGIGYFSSMYERKVMEFMGMLGYSQNEHDLKEVGGTPITESMLGVRYKIVREPSMFGYYESKYRNKSFDLQYNKNALPLGFMIRYGKFDPNADKELEEGVLEENSLVFQDFVLSEWCGRRIHAYDNIEYKLEEVESDEYARHVKARFIAQSDKPIWMYCKPDYSRIVNSTDYSETDNQTDAILKINGKAVYPFADSTSTMCTYIGEFKPGEEVEIEAAWINSFADPWIAYYNADECEKALKSLKERGVEVTDHFNGTIRGQITVEDEEDLLVITLPYNRGYHIRVDGNRVEYGAYRDVLLAVKICPGDHTLEITYVPYGFVPGSVFGIVFIIVTGLYLYYPRSYQGYKL